jgi:AcrR family transcriptional regulator
MIDKGLETDGGCRMAGMTPDASSRDRRRARVEQIALELFRAKGFEQVTVEDVCAEAGVAPATFYRHFGTKEEVVFAYWDEFLAALRRATDAVADAPEPARLRMILEDFATFLESQQDLLALRDQIVLGHPRLMQRTVIAQRDVEAVLAIGLARLRGLEQPDADALTQAGLGMTVIRVAVRTWRAGDEGSLLSATRAALARLAEVVERWGVSSD